MNVINQEYNNYNSKVNNKFTKLFFKLLLMKKSGLIN